MVTTRRQSQRQATESDENLLKRTKLTHQELKHEHVEEEEEEEYSYDDEEEEGNGMEEEEEESSDFENWPYVYSGEDADFVLPLIKAIHYSQRYYTDVEEFRHVIMPKELYDHYVPESMKKRLLSDCEWRLLGLQMSAGWEHYELHRPEPHILLFRRPRTS